MGRLERRVLRLLSRVRVGWRLTLAIAVLLAPLLVLSIGYVQTKIDAIRVAALEKESLAYLVPLNRLMRHLADHRGLTSLYLRGGAAVLPNIRDAEQEIDQDLAQLERMDARLGSTLKTRERSASIKSIWSAFKATSQKVSADESFALHTALIAQVLETHDLVVETSGMLLDPRPETFYLIDAVMLRGPALGEQIAQLRGQTADLVQQAGSEPTLQKGTVVAIAGIHTRFETLRDALARAYRYTPDRRAEIERSLGNAEMRLLAFLDETEHVSHGDTQGFTAQDVFALGTRALDAYDEFKTVCYDVIGQELDQAISQLRRDALVAAVSLMGIFALAFVTAILGVRSVTTPIRHFVGVVGRLSQGDKTARTALDTGDEIGVLARQFDTMMDERQRSEEQLRLSEERFRLSIEGISDYAIYLLDAGGRVVSWNAGAEHIKGYRSEEILGQHFSCFYPPQDQARGKPRLALQEAEQKGRYEEEGWRLRKNGSAFWATEVITAIRDVSGGLSGFVEVTRDLTERRRQGLELRTKQAELVAMNDASPLGMFRTDAQGRCLYVNRTYELISGLTWETALGDGWSQVIHPEDRDRVMQEWAAAAQANASYEDIHRLVRPDGRIAWVSVESSPIIVYGEVVGHVGTIDDITERRASEEARRRLAAVLEISTDFVATTDFHGRVRDINPAGRRLLGIAADANVNGTTIADYFPPWVVQLLIEEARPVAMAQGIWTAETAVWDKDHHEIPIHHMVLAQKTPEGRVEFFASVMRDISATKEAERALQQSEERLRLVTDSLPALISYLDRDQRFRFANKAYKDWLGVEPEQLIGQSLREFYGEAVYAGIQSHVETALAGHEVGYEREMPAGSGHHHRYVHVTLVPHRDEAGAVLGLYALINDISGRRAAELALHQSEARLRTIADALPMRVAYVDADERYRFNNLAYERVFGTPRQAIYGRTIREVMGDTAYRTIEPHVRRALQGETVTYQSEMTTRDSYRCYEATYLPQFGEDGTTVLGFHSVVVDMTSQKLEERRLIRLGQIDGLTGVVNRSGFQERLREAMARSQASGGLMAVMYLDIDRFKQVNDQLGHGTGDALLKAFAGRLTQTLRSSDTTARLGGDEFTIIMEGFTKPEDAATVAAKIVKTMQAPFALDERTVEVTTSLGLAFYQGGETTPEALLRHADEMLYQAKAAGRNNYQVAPLLRVSN